MKEHLQHSYGSATLLLLDNFEQVIGAAPLVAELLEASAATKILATSRALLHVYGEHEFAVAPLALPDLKRLPDVKALSQYPAVALFLQRAVGSGQAGQVREDGAPVRAFYDTIEVVP